MSDKTVPDFHVQVRLADRDGGHVADVFIPAFQKLPEVIEWGERFFAFHEELKADGEPCVAEYREVFSFWIPPGYTVPAGPKKAGGR